MKAFNEIQSYEAFEKFRISIKNEIEGKTKEYILSVDENEYKNYLYEKYALQPLNVYLDEEQREQPVKSKEWREDSFYREKYQVDTYTFTIKYPFSGSPSLFRLHPSSWTMTSHDINVDEHKSTVSIKFTIYKQDVNEFNKELASSTRSAFANLDNANSDANRWNTELKSLVKTYFDNHKSKLLKENDFFAAINIPIDKSTQSIFTAPTITKKDIPQPILSKSKEFSTEPMMSKTMYDDILKVIYDTGKGMERKPSLYINKDEEALRDIFLLLLESRYEAMTATSETFNRSGKTDMIVKYANDGSNIFVSECKFWHGPQGYVDTINQLFDRYLTWRDSKVAIMIFVQNKDFTSVIKNIANTSRTHPYFVKEVGHRGETSFSYVFSLPQDTSKHVYLEVMAFHYDK